MKKTRFFYSLLLVLALPFLLNSCSNDDDKEDKNDIVGTWIWTATSTDIEGATDAQRQNILRNWDNDPDSEDDFYKLKFSSDKTMTDGDDDTFSYHIDGNNILLFNDTPYTFSLSGNTLILTDDMKQNYPGTTKVLIHYTFTRQ